MIKRTLGLWNMGDGSFHPLLDPQKSKAIIKEALKDGTTSFDTAFSYKNADTILHSALKESHTDRDKIEIISKVMPVETLEKKTDIVLRRIGTDYLDALLLHWPTDDCLLFDAMKRLERIKESGKAKEIGVSNFPIKLLEKVCQDFDVKIHERPLSLIWPRDYEKEKKLGISTYCYAPLAMGILAKDRNLIPDDMRSSLYIYNSGKEEYEKLRDTMDMIKTKTVLSYAEISYSWVVSKSPDAIIFGISGANQMPKFENKLEKEMIKALDDASDRLCLKADGDNIFSHNYLTGTY